jgi:hypothetical protein
MCINLNYEYLLNTLCSGLDNLGQVFSKNRIFFLNSASRSAMVLHTPSCPVGSGDFLLGQVHGQCMKVATHMHYVPTKSRTVPTLINTSS